MKNTIHAYLNSENSDHAQIVLSTRDEAGYNVESIEFEVFDADMGIQYGARVTWQHAGVYVRNSHHLPKVAHLAPLVGATVQRWTELLTSRARTESGAARYHSLHPQLLTVQLEGDEISQLWDRLNAVSHNERQGVLLEVARELTGLSLTHSVQVR